MSDFKDSVMEVALLAVAIVIFTPVAIATGLALLYVLVTYPWSV